MKGTCVLQPPYPRSEVRSILMEQFSLHNIQNNYSLHILHANLLQTYFTPPPPQAQIIYFPAILAMCLSCFILCNCKLNQLRQNKIGENALKMYNLGYRLYLHIRGSGGSIAGLYAKCFSNKCSAYYEIRTVSLGLT